MLCYIAALQHTSIDVYAYAYQRIILLILLAYCATKPRGKVGSRVHFFASHTAQICTAGTAEGLGRPDNEAIGVNRGPHGSKLFQLRRCMKGGGPEVGTI